MPHHDPAAIVLADSPDVVASLARPGLLTTRSGHPVEVVVEPSVRSDILVRRLAARPVDPPDDLPASVAPWWEAATVPSATGAKVLVVSLRGELATAVFRHHRSGVVFQVPDDAEPDAETARWLAAECEAVGSIDEGATAANLAEVADRLGDGTRLMAYNLSTYVPDGDDIEAAIAFGARAQRLDLALAQVAGDHPITVVDVDRVVAELGAAEHVTGPGRYSAEASGDIGEEAVNQIDALRVLDPMHSELALLLVPRYDRRTTSGAITRWHKQAGDAVEPGDVLFDIEFGGLSSHLGATKDVKMDSRVMTLGVVAGEAGHLLEVLPVRDVAVGDPVAVVGARPDLDPMATTELTPHFRVGMRVVER